MKDLTKVVQQAVANIGVTKVNTITYNHDLLLKLKDEGHPHSQDSIKALTAVKFGFVEQIEEILMSWVYADTVAEETNLYTEPNQWRDYMNQHNGGHMYDLFEDMDNDAQLQKDYFGTVADIVYQHIITNDFEIPDYWKPIYENN
ncbi:hypothetical protein EVJ32_10655 [Exiguobacterium sp. SH5S4]|uniref:hypothetical protein n=1 Tax=Exiguobacterium sp. SH5S4 TaxID=2510961 RepID=UPI00103C0C0B|nr:hypothetical protein [Exiguobacterium sp. SH5S4]TCI25253.1 hypothetical protein EVJ32_10655 [Exiguobacterium sp. SH5S4]